MEPVCPTGTLCFTSSHVVYGLVVVAIGIMYWIHTHREQTSRLQHRLHNVSQQMATVETQLQTLHPHLSHLSSMEFPLRNLSAN
jgi:hypothetical protein